MQCLALTMKGARCGSEAAPEHELCYQHKSMEAKGQPVVRDLPENADEKSRRIAKEESRIEGLPGRREKLKAAQQARNERTKAAWDQFRVESAAKAAARDREKAERAQKEAMREAEKKNALARMSGHDYIEDKDVYKAVQFARKMMRDGTPKGLANYKAAAYYDVDQSEVAKHTGQVGFRTKARRAGP